MAAYTARKSGIVVPNNGKSFSSTYEAARITRHRKWLPPVTKDSKEVLTPSVLRLLRSAGRNIFANNGFARGAILDVSRYLVGFNGILPQSLSRDPGWAEDIQDRWVNWLNIADFRRELHFNQILRAANVEMDVDGDFGFVLTETGGGDGERPGMAQIQTVRAHRIDDPNDNPAGSVGGIVEDRIGTTVAYSILDGPDQKQRLIPRESFILVGDPELSDWKRYPTAIAHGINSVRDESEIMGFVYDGLKARTARAFWKKTPTGNVDDDELDPNLNTDSSDNALLLEEIQGGEIPRLGPGEELHELNTDYPGGLVMPTLTWNKREFACGYGTPLEVIWESNLSGPAQHFALSKFQRRIDERRGFVMIPHLLTRLWGYFVSKEIKRKAIRFDPDWWRVRWIPTSPRVRVDIGREAQQNREDLLLGNRTLEQDAGESGINWRALREQSEVETSDLIDRAKRLAKTKDIPFELALSLLSKRSPNGNLPVAPVAATSANPLND